LKHTISEIIAIEEILEIPINAYQELKPKSKSRSLTISDSKFLLMPIRN